MKIIKNIVPVVKIIGTLKPQKKIFKKIQIVFFLFCFLAFLVMFF